MTAVLPEPVNPSALRVEWAYRSQPFQGVSFSFGIRSDDVMLGTYVEQLVRSLEGGSVPEHWYSLQHAATGLDLFLDDVCIAQLPTESAAIEWLLWDVNRSVAEASSHLLELHAGAVQAGTEGIVFPAPSGSGKSTLVAGLVRQGLRYLTDELVCLSDDGATLSPYPKPIALKGTSIELFRTDDVAARTGPFLGEEWYLRPDDLGADAIGEPCRPSLIVLPRYQRDTETALRRLSDTETFLALALNSVNLDAHGERGTELIADLIARCPAYELVMSDLGAACTLVLGLVAGLDHPE
jgi:hypothetical protein